MGPVPASQECSVGTLGVSVHEIAAEPEEVRLAILEPRAHSCPCLCARDAMPEKTGETRKEAGGDAKVFEEAGLLRHR